MDHQDEKESLGLSLEWFDLFQTIQLFVQLMVNESLQPHDMLHYMLAQELTVLLCEPCDALQGLLLLCLLVIDLILSNIPWKLILEQKIPASLHI